MPETKHYTATSSSNITIGSTTGVIYDGVKDNGVSCYLTATTQDTPSTPTSFTKMMINEVPAFGTVNYYFVNAAATRFILASNSTMGVTGKMYRYDSDNNQMIEMLTEVHLDSCTPSDYYDTIKSGDFEIEVV